MVFSITFFLDLCLQNIPQTQIILHVVQHISVIVMDVDPVLFTCDVIILGHHHSLLIQVYKCTSPAEANLKVAP